MTADLAAAAAALVLVGALAPRMYRRGRGHRGMLLPRALVDELRAHKLDCLGEPAQRVALELELLVGDTLSDRKTAAPPG
jgi:hypothetical protein